MRVPLMYRQSGGQDEDYYAVPGQTILRDGLPRIPYVPSRDFGGVFYRADEALFALPPAYFYWQAAVYWFTGPSYGSGRLASALAASLAALLIFDLARRVYANNAIALSAAAVFLFARISYLYAGTMARPDMLCCLFGLASIRLLWQWHIGGSRAWISAAGALSGLGLLTHPFAAVYCLQLTGWLLFSAPPQRIEYSRPWMRLGQRLETVLLLLGCAAIVFVGLWLPLIQGHFQAFLIQFGNNVWNRSGSGFAQSLTTPWRPVLAQSRLFLELNGPPQSALLLLGLCTATWLDWRRDRNHACLVALTWSAILLLVLLQGEHPAKGYWCYPGAYLALSVGRTAAAVATGLSERAVRWPRTARSIVAITIMSALIPGSGIRTVWQHLLHANEVNYNHRAFVERLLAETPVDARYLVDVSCVFDFYLAGRDVRLALNIAPYFEAAGRPFNYLIVGPTGLRQRLPEQLGGRLVRRYGIPDNDFACYAELHVAAGRQK